MPKKWIFLVLVAVGLACVQAGTAAAHNVLIGSDPADGASLATPPSRVSLTFDLPVQPGLSIVTVTGPDGSQWQQGPPVEDGAVVSTPIRPLGPAGEYVIGYQVVSADGHPVRGVVRFTMTAPGTATLTAPPTTGSGETAPGSRQEVADSPGEAAEPPGETGAEDTASGDTPVWPWLLGVGVLLAAGVAMALRIGRTGS